MGFGLLEFYRLLQDVMIKVMQRKSSAQFELLRAFYYRRAMKMRKDEKISKKRHGKTRPHRLTPRATINREIITPQERHIKSMV